MASLNQCNFIGNLGSDVSIKYTQDGKAVGSVNIAVTEKYKDQERTEWVRLVFWGKSAEILEKYSRKGSSLFVSGRLQTRQWEKDGQQHYTTEIVVSNFQFLGGGDPKSCGSNKTQCGNGNYGGYQQQNGNPPRHQNQNRGYKNNQNDVHDDDIGNIPF